VTETVDLDLTYITPKIVGTSHILPLTSWALSSHILSSFVTPCHPPRAISSLVIVYHTVVTSNHALPPAMSLPATGLQATYRNKLTDVANFLTARHGTCYMIINVSDKSYDISEFKNQVNNVCGVGSPGCITHTPTQQCCSQCGSEALVGAGSTRHILFACLHALGTRLWVARPYRPAAGAPLQVGQERDANKSSPLLGSPLLCRRPSLEACAAVCVPALTRGWRPTPTTS
jgi:hypothetical protein